MGRPLPHRLRKAAHEGLRRGLVALPRDWRFALYRQLVACDDAPDARLELKIAQTQEELDACFRLLHDAYVGAGFMKPDPSGLRVTIYHALPTTTTLCAKWDGEVVGTMSMIREGVFGFPMQSAFDLESVRARQGQIAEISALAVAPAFRRTGGVILFPLMKFMYAYCRRYFDTRHLVIAVNPNKIELYEALLTFRRLPAAVVDTYDFANGAPAVGASLDLDTAEAEFARLYATAKGRRNLHRYFVETVLPNIRLPERPLYTTNDPVMTPALLDHFFNHRTRTFDTMDERKRLLLRSIYDRADYASVLPPVPASASGIALRRHQRYSLRCPATLNFESYGTTLAIPLDVIEISKDGLGARSEVPIPEGTRGIARVQLGERRASTVQAVSVRCRVVEGLHHYGFRLERTDAAWDLTVQRLEHGCTTSDLEGDDPAAPREHAQRAIAAAFARGVDEPTKAQAVSNDASSAAAAG